MNASDISKVSVDATQLRVVSEDTFRRIQQYRESINTILKLVDSTSEVWKGEAGDAYRAVFKQEYARAIEVLDEFRTIPEALLTFAGIYSDTIDRANKLASGPTEFNME